VGAGLEHERKGSETGSSRLEPGVEPQVVEVARCRAQRGPEADVALPSRRNSTSPWTALHQPGAAKPSVLPLPHTPLSRPAFHCGLALGGGA
jgi:hypothetical protein